MNIVRVPEEWLRSETVLPRNVYSRGGEKVARAGTRVSEELASRLREDGWLHQEMLPESLLHLECSWNRKDRLPGVRLNVRSRFFAAAERMLVALDGCYATLLSRGNVSVQPVLMEIAAGIQLALSQDDEGFLASLELFDGAQYALLHALHSAALCDLVGMVSGEAESDRKRLVAAALTRDLGFVALQEILDRNKGGLDSHQRRQMEWHPRLSRRLLEEAGVSDPQWLLAVEQHHERLDGSGYPEGTVGEGIHPWARMLGIADIYSAMTKPRGYRDAIQGTGALQELFSKRGGEVDATITARFVGALGIFPPGSLVKLASGETAMVIRQTGNPRYPFIKAIATPDGHIIPLCPTRDPADPHFAIEAILPRQAGLLARINHRQLWGDPDKIHLKSSVVAS